MPGLNIVASYLIFELLDGLEAIAHGQHDHFSSWFTLFLDYCL